MPAALFWSLSIYDNQHRSFLETDQKLAGIDCTFPAMKKIADGSATVWFSPNAPAGQEGNWVQTLPGKGWFTMFRLYGPLQPWFDKTWNREISSWCRDRDTSGSSPSILKNSIRRKGPMRE